MKKWLLIFLGLCFFYISDAQITGKGQLTTDNPPKLKWKSEVVDVGNVPIFKPIEVNFIFYNVGDKPIIIYNAEGSCGCVSVEYPKHPVPPKDSAVIKVIYRPTELGLFKKQAYIYTNLQPPDDEQIVEFTGKAVRKTKK